MKYVLVCIILPLSFIAHGQCTVGNANTAIEVMQSLELSGITSGNDLIFCMYDTELYSWGWPEENTVTVNFEVLSGPDAGQTGSYSGGGGGLLIPGNVLFTAEFIAQQAGAINIQFDDGFNNFDAEVSVTIEPDTWEDIVADMVTNNSHEVSSSYNFTTGDLRLSLRISEFINCPGEIGSSRFTITFTDVETGNIIHVLDQNCEVAEILPNSEVNVTFDPISPGDTQIEWSSDNVTTQTATLTSAFVLPIELSGFTATATQKQTHLSWQTASESQNRGFHLQHSPNGQTWSPLDFIPGVGDSQTERDYAYTHRNPVPGTNYYRLEQEDYDGTRTLSEVVTAEFGGVGELSITPNPATEVITVTSPLLTEGEDFTLTVYDASGRQLLEQRNARQLQVAELPAGVYTLMLKAGGEVETERFVRR